MKAIIIGAGGHAAELVDYIRYSNQYENVDSEISIAGLLDDNHGNYLKYNFDFPFLGEITTHIIRHDLFYIIGIANLEYRKKFVNYFLKQGAKFTSYIHPSVSISSSATLGEGVVISPNVNLGPNSYVGDFSLVNSRASIGHDTKIGKFNFLSPNVCFSGFTEVGDENLFGINAATIPGIRIGDRNKIMAGMTLEKNVSNDEVVFYRYKERISVIKV
ncbi:MAG: acetyltransferase [Algoriphagus sp.]|uniref:acetyltransferase n=1 Tax=Algoriphagus sp. TaxID=1872435 RepID=UPI00261D5F9A|nr:acetyltransferase [Algoriphagus sp.]MDG1279218.1 acetyltransferase [Algoriphagus sp.]